MQRNSASTWVGKGVIIKNGCYPEQIGKSAVVLAVDGEKPMAWLKVDTGTEVPGYLTVELGWVERVDSGEPGTF